MTFSDRAIEAAGVAVKKRRQELIHAPLSYIYDELAKAALTAALAVDGLVLVPKEPTDAVLRAGYQAWVDDKYDGSQAPLMCAVWTAMLTAASDGEAG